MTAKTIVNPDGCSSCFPCLAVTDAGCDCPANCHDPDSWDLPANAAGDDEPVESRPVPDRLRWDEGDVEIVRSGYTLTVEGPEPGEVRLVETVDDLLDHCSQTGQDPQQLVDDLKASGSLRDAPADFYRELKKKGWLP